jgi:protein-S-isoprenylcysteine O-methyltransferase Ste14
MPSLGGNIAISTLFTLFGGPGLVLVLIPRWLTHFRVPAHEPLPQTVAACFLIAIGLVPLLESIVRFVIIGRGTLVPTAPPKHLVVTGMYHFVRNPMYVGVVTAIAGESLLLWQRGLLIHLAVVCLAMHLFVCRYEEPRLAQLFGDEYLDYCRHVGRWIPRPTPWRRSTFADKFTR